MTRGRISRKGVSIFGLHQPAHPNQGYGDSGNSSPTLINVTFSGNSAVGYGGALPNDGENAGNSTPTLKNVILWGDTGTDPTAEINNDANNGGNALSSIDHGVVQGGCPAGSSCTDVSDANPLLGSLGNHGGYTATLLLGTGSSAIDTGDDAACAAAPVNEVDQRGTARPQADHCDIGAVEMIPILDRIFCRRFRALIAGGAFACAGATGADGQGPLPVSVHRRRCHRSTSFPARFDDRPAAFAGRCSLHAAKPSRAMRGRVCRRDRTVHEPRRK